MSTERVIKDHPISETADLIEKRKEMSREAWIKNLKSFGISFLRPNLNQ